MTDKNKLMEAGNPSELADLIDRLMENGSGHVNITAGDDRECFTVETVKSSDCNGAKGACCQPTELNAYEEDE